MDITTAPDGTMYITDMYHGIIQVGNFTGPGSYLRSKIEQYDLDKVIHKGRIWRLVYDGVKPDRSDRIRRDVTRPRMHNATPAQLVRHLSHPNGWWRDTAQQLLVLRRDPRERNPLQGGRAIAGERLPRHSRKTRTSTS